MASLRPSITLTGSQNYESWRESMCTFAMIHKFYGYLTGRKRPPKKKVNSNGEEDEEAASKAEEYQENMEVAMGWILVSVSPRIKRYIKHLRTAKKMMDRLEDDLGRREGPWGAFPNSPFPGLRYDCTIYSTKCRKHPLSTQDILLILSSSHLGWGPPQSSY